MTLLDHFRPPLSNRRHWHSFHNAWATYIAASLNETLPPGYFAEPNVQFGIKIDVAAFEEANIRSPKTGGGKSWQPEAPTQTIPFQLTTDLVEIAVFSAGSGPTLAGAIELVSPANKDRPAHRHAFTAKCQTYLQQGIGLIVVDLVTTLNANLHNELLSRLNAKTNASDTHLYTVAYQVSQQANETALNLWESALNLGDDLPYCPSGYETDSAYRSTLAPPMNAPAANSGLHLSSRELPDVLLLRNRTLASNFTGNSLYG